MKRHTFFKTAVLVMMGTLAAYAIADSQESIEDRIKPVGDVCMAGDDCAAAVVSSSSASGPRSGEEVYSSKCFTCHATGAAGAPKVGDQASWSSRIDARGVEGLYTGAISGFQGMPPKGLCMDCSDDELKAAVDHMLSNSGL